MKRRPAIGPARRVSALLSALALLLLLPCAPARPQERFSADAVKAAYLFRIAGYVKWPRTLPSDAPFTIDVLGDESVGEELQQLLPGHPIEGHPAQVVLIERISQIGDAQMLYIGPQFSGDVHQAIVSSAGRPMLVVTDERRGLADGGVINFVEDGKHVRFEVSLIAAAHAGLSISSQLLSVALRVEGAHFGSGMYCERAGLMGGWAFDCPQQMLASAVALEGAALR